MAEDDLTLILSSFQPPLRDFRGIFPLHLKPIIFLSCHD